MKILGFKGDLDILITQLVTLKGKPKISKRKGEILTLQELIDEIGLDTARFFYLQKSLDTHMEIDLELAREQSEKNPVYYIQYAHTRICGILRKGKIQTEKIKAKIQNLKLLEHPSELNLIKQLIRFPEIVEDCAKDYQLQRIPKYALDLATSFHQFYRDCKVLTENSSLKEARLALILATKTVLKNTLNLMGISTPERM
jgi:arginyl-tRNA synthetase